VHHAPQKRDKPRRYRRLHPLLSGFLNRRPQVRALPGTPLLPTPISRLTPFPRAHLGGFAPVHAGPTRPRPATKRHDRKRGSAPMGAPAVPPYSAAHRLAWSISVLPRIQLSACSGTVVFPWSSLVQGHCPLTPPRASGWCTIPLGRPIRGPCICRPGSHPSGRIRPAQTTWRECARGVQPCSPRQDRERYR
jgi:hypothetical protein